MDESMPRNGGKRLGSELATLEILRNWRQKLTDNPLDPETIQSGLLMLSDIGESALIHAVRYGKKVEEVHESQEQVKGRLQVVQEQISTVISKFESATSVQNNESETVATQLRELKGGVDELHEMTTAIITHLNISVPANRPKTT